MLRVYFPATRSACRIRRWRRRSTDSPTMRGFVGDRPRPRAGAGRDQRSAASAICFEEHDLGRRLFDEVQRHLAAKGLKVATSRIINANDHQRALRSTQNTARPKRSRECMQDRQRIGGLGVDTPSWRAKPPTAKLIHAVVATASHRRHGAARAAARQRKRSGRPSSTKHVVIMTSPAGQGFRPNPPLWPLRRVDETCGEEPHHRRREEGSSTASASRHQAGLRLHQGPVWGSPRTLHGLVVHLRAPPTS